MIFIFIQKYHSNGFVRPIGIKIKTEASIESQIKQEVYTDRHSARQQTPKLAIAQEKQKLIDGYVAMKSENQRLTFELNKKSEECLKLAAEKFDLEQKLVSSNDKIKQLESNFVLMNGEYAENMNEYKQKLTDITQQNQKLNACYKQLQTSMARTEKTTDKSANIFDVEKIIGDKKMGNVQYYKVRWEGYGEEDDTWERETNLFCTDILEEYLKNKKAN